jgi:hypothetical protein
MRAGRTVVTIDELRLRGFDARRSSGIGEALTRELTRRAALQPGVARDVAKAVAAAIRREARRPC